MWCKNPKPAKGPKPPREIVPAVLSAIRMSAKVDLSSPKSKFLNEHLPKEQFDRWLQPLPLSIVQQDRVNRMIAMFVAPIDRGRALLLSGQLDTLDMQVLRDGIPDAYEILRTQAVREMAEAGPPLPQWSEAVLGVLFGRSAAHVFAEEKTDEEGKPQAGNGFAGKPPVPTPQEQRDNVQRK